MRKHLNFKEELSSKKGVVRRFSKVRKRIADKRDERARGSSDSHTGVKAKYFIRYRFPYGHLPQNVTQAQIKMIKERRKQWEKSMSDVYIRTIKRILVSIKRHDAERIYTIIENVLYQPDLFRCLSILEIRKLAEFFSKKHPSYAIAILEAARDYELGLSHQDYSMMLKLYRMLEDHHIGAMYTLDILKAQGFNPSLEDYLNLLNVLIMKGVSLQQVLNYIEEMTAKNFQMDYYVTSLLIDRLMEQNNIAVAGDLFMSMITKRQTTHGLILPEIFMRQQEGEESSRDLSLYVTIYSVLIQTFISHDHYDKAMEFYWKLLDKQPSPDDQIVEMMISACLVRNDAKTVQKFLQHTQTPAISHVYFQAMGHCIKNRNFKDLFKLYEISWEKNVIFTEQEYHNLIYSLYIADCVTDAFRVYKDARSKGLLSSDLFIHNKLLRALLKYERTKDVGFIKQEMEDLGIKSDLETYGILIQLSAMQREPEKAETIFREIHQSGLSLDYTIFSSLIKCFADLGDLEKSKKALNLMYKSGFKPTINDYNNLIRAAGKLTNYEVKKIGILILRGNRNKHKLTPNIDTYNCFLESYLASNFLSVAKKICKTIIKDGFEFNLETFHILFRHCYIIQGHKAAFEFFYDQLEYNELEPSVYTWNLLMEKAIESKSPKIIRQIYSELYKRGIKLNRTSLYSRLISFWGYEKEYPEAEAVLDHLRVGRADDYELINSIDELVKIYIIHKHYHKAENLWKLIQIERLIPNENLYNNLIKLYTLMENDDELRKVYKVISDQE
ncbi:17551_t:CDS:1 [Funneliformis geosporum]|uniref:9058_t:CDS:1 n=1 Tax=Funneliformis geosporum TaxID=1117311 RepID=A0A9W4WY82_9GLOM|nr:17551_t:CDS:1 [Funneliformis geosporum]CAI2181205.1 9058_t:CDS:1 [Funneliformis geosporum]